MTFDPHPPRVVRPDKAPPLLMTTAQRLEALTRAGMQGVAVVRFTPRDVAVGSGDVRAHGSRRVAPRRRSVGRRQLSLRPRSRRAPSSCCGRSAHATGSARRRSIPSATRTSSSAARASAGWCRRAASTRRARCSAITTSSTAPSCTATQRGREIGFPTANLETANELLPPAGVYATTAAINGIAHPSVTNVGMRPTFGDVDRPPGRDAPARRSTAISTTPRIRLSFVQRLRDERAFPGRGRAARADRRRLPGGPPAVRPHFAIESHDG